MRGRHRRHRCSASVISGLGIHTIIILNGPLLWLQQWPPVASGPGLLARHAPLVGVTMAPSGDALPPAIRHATALPASTRSTGTLLLVAAHANDHVRPCWRWGKPTASRYHAVCLGAPLGHAQPPPARLRHAGGWLCYDPGSSPVVRSLCTRSAHCTMSCSALRLRARAFCRLLRALPQLALAAAPAAARYARGSAARRASADLALTERSPTRSLVADRTRMSANAKFM